MKSNEKRIESIELKLQDEQFIYIARFPNDSRETPKYPIKIVYKATIDSKGFVTCERII